MYRLNVILRIKPDRREDFLACILANQQGTMENEPLALSYVFGEGCEEILTVPIFLRMQAYVMATILEHLDHEGFGTIRNALASSFATRYGQRSATDLSIPIQPLQNRLPM